MSGCRVEHASCRFLGMAVGAYNGRDAILGRFPRPSRQGVSRMRRRRRPPPRWIMAGGQAPGDSGAAKAPGGRPSISPRRRIGRMACSPRACSQNVCYRTETHSHTLWHAHTFGGDLAVYAAVLEDWGPAPPSSPSGSRGRGRSTIVLSRRPWRPRRGPGAGATKASSRAAVCNAHTSGVCTCPCLGAFLSSCVVALFCLRHRHDRRREPLLDRVVLRHPQDRAWYIIGDRLRWS